MITKDEDVMLKALRKEREELHERILQLDRIIKRVKAGDYIGFVPPKDRGVEGNDSSVQPSIIPLNGFPKQADIRVQIIKVFDEIGKAARLGELQALYNKLSGKNYNIRENVRSLHRAKIVRILKVKDATRGMFWVKAEWLENGKLLDEYKPEGFDVLYKPENLLFE